MLRRSLILMIMAFLLILLGCNNNRFNMKNIDYRYGVIETTGQENMSYLSFYNVNLEKVGEEKIKYGSMGDGFALPIVFDKSMFIAPKGIYNQKELTFIMEYDLDGFEIEKWDTGLQNMNSIAVNNDFIFGVNTMDFTSNIIKCNRKTKELSKIQIPDTYISYIEVYENELFGFGESEDSGKMKSFLYIIDTNTLDIQKEIDISHIGFGQYDTVIKDNKLYFTASYSIDSIENQPTNKLLEYNRKSGEIKTYSLKESFPFQILEYGNNLLITHFDPVGVTGSIISIFNIDYASSELIEFNHNIEHLGLDGDDIIILGNGYLYRYNKEFSLMASTPITNTKKTDYHYYTTGLFKR